jgi:hypothetical protein
MLISLFSLYIASRPASQRMSFGWHRAGIFFNYPPSHTWVEGFIFSKNLQGDKGTTSKIFKKRSSSPSAAYGIQKLLKFQWKTVMAEWLRTWTIENKAPMGIGLYPGPNLKFF